MTPWYTHIWNAVLNEPFTVIGFLGVAFAWWWRHRIHKSESETAIRERDEDRKLEIAEIVQDAHFLLDRVSHQLDLIFQRLELPDDARKEVETDLQKQTKKIRRELIDLDINDTSHDNLLEAKRLLSVAKRLNAITTDNVEQIRE